MSPSNYNSCEGITNNNDDKKNIKNIYVQKINSLMKLSRNQLNKDDLENPTNNQKKKIIAKISSEMDRNTMKLQKNRECAKKARLRKKIYLKMLQSQIQCFKKIKDQGQQLNQQAQTFLLNQQHKNNRNQINSYIQHDVNVDKFLSGNNFSQVYKIGSQQFEQKLNQRDSMIEELYQLSTSGLVKKLKHNKNLQIFQSILKRQVRQNIHGFEQLIKRIVFYYDNVKNSFRKLQQITQNSKNLSRKCRNIAIQQYEMNNFNNQMTSVQQFMQKLNLNRQNDYQEPIQQQFKVYECLQFLNSKTSLSKQSSLSDLNLHTTEKLLIRSQKFFQYTIFEQQQHKKQ